MNQVARGEIWLVDLDPVRGREQAGQRPCLVISVDRFNQGSSELAIALPLTSKNKNIPFHVAVSPPEANLRLKSFIKCEDVRSISRDRFRQYLGTVTPQTIVQVEDRLRILMGL